MVSLRKLYECKTQVLKGALNYEGLNPANVLVDFDNSGSLRLTFTKDRCDKSVTLSTMLKCERLADLYYHMPEHMSDDQMSVIEYCRNKYLMKLLHTPVYYIAGTTEFETEDGIVFSWDSDKKRLDVSNQLTYQIVGTWKFCKQQLAMQDVEEVDALFKRLNKSEYTECEVNIQSEEFVEIRLPNYLLDINLRKEKDRVRVSLENNYIEVIYACIAELSKSNLHGDVTEILFDYYTYHVLREDGVTYISDERGTYIQEAGDIIANIELFRVCDINEFEAQLFDNGTHYNVSWTKTKGFILPSKDDVGCEA